MKNFDSPIGLFFEEYERNAESGDTAAAVAQFAEAFVAAGPGGAQVVRASDFGMALPKRKALFDRLGCRSTRLILLEEIRLDGRYVLAKTQWRLMFASSEGREEAVVVSSGFVVDALAEPFRIVLYLASQDIFAVLRERGILREGSAETK